MIAIKVGCVLQCDFHFQVIVGSHDVGSTQREKSELKKPKMLMKTAEN